MRVALDDIADMPLKMSDERRLEKLDEDDEDGEHEAALK